MTKLSFLRDFPQVQNELQQKKSLEYICVIFIFYICICEIHSFFFFFCSQLTHELSLTWSVAHLVTLPRPLQTSFLPFDSECFISAILAYGRPECEDVKNREE